MTSGGRMNRWLWLLSGLVLAGCAASVEDAADLVLLNGRIVTVDETRPEAQAVAVVGDRIRAVGSNRGIRRHVGPGTRVIDLEGRLAVPGFIDGHAHFLGVGEARISLDLTRAESWAELVAQVAEAVATTPEGEWVVGRGWHQEKWTEVPADTVQGVPTHQSLSAVSPAHPVLLVHASGHAAFANAEALRQGGIDRSYRPPPGGEVVRDAAGEATGLLREHAMQPVQAARARAEEGRTPEQRWAQFRRIVELASEEALSKGVTTIHDAGASFATIDGFRRLAEAGALPVRLYVMVREPSQVLAERLADYRLIGLGNDHLTVRSIKKQIDGALGAHGAWLLEPYADLESTGLVLEPVAEVERTAELALAHGFQLNTHAIGDRANREVLDIYERVFAANPEAVDLRWRIEHAQHVHANDIPRFAALGVIASMQGVHGTSDAPWVPRRLGEERAARTSYRWQDLWRSGAVVTNGTDAPVEDLDPIGSFWASISRRLPDGERFDPDQRMTRAQALRSYTLNNAYAAFEEELKGSITPGKLADIVVLSENILRVPEERVLSARVVYTIVGGRVLYQEGSSPTTR
jgi:predicted amidohydrolase YtcJ